MDFGDLDRLDDGDGRGEALLAVTCSICLEIITGGRSSAKLQCGHQFHLDCIGSAFNIKGAMECPNCRKVEEGQWLYSNGSRSDAEDDMEEWVLEEYPSDPNHSEMTFVVYWCPVNGYTRIPSSFGEGALSSTAYNFIVRQHGVIVLPTAVSSGSHHRPYVAYSGPYSSSLHSSGNVSNGSTFSSHWNNQSSTTSSRVPGPDQPPSPSMTQRVARDNFGMARSGYFVHPSAVDHGTNDRAGSSVATSMPTPFPDSAARFRERMLALQAYFQHPPGNSQGESSTPLVPSPRRSNGHMNMTQGEPGAAMSGQARGSYLFPSTSSAGRNILEAQNSMPNRYNAWEREQSYFFSSSQAEREPIWVPFHELLGAPNTGIRPAYIRRGNRSERMPSQHQS